MSNIRGTSTPQELDQTYGTSCTALTQALMTAFSISQATRTIPSNTQAREYWASVLFARMCGFGGSMHKLLPLSAANPNGAAYDFASVAAICRSLFEAYVSFLYLCSPTLSAEQYLMRLRLVQLHDCMRRPEILRKIGDTPDQRWFDEQALGLRNDLMHNSEFLKLGTKRQTDVLKGRSPMHLSQDDVILTEGGDVTAIRGIYEFLSSHTHSFPFSYWRTPEHGDRGTGRENPVDKGYIAIAAELGASLLEEGSKQMKQVFPGVTNYPRWNINWDTMTGTQPSRTEHIFGVGGHSF